jgi:hypothetical protein
VFFSNSGATRDTFLQNAMNFDSALDASLSASSFSVFRSDEVLAGEETARGEGFSSATASAGDARFGFGGATHVSQYPLHRAYLGDARSTLELEIVVVDIPSDIFYELRQRVRAELHLEILVALTTFRDAATRAPREVACSPPSISL